MSFDIFYKILLVAFTYYSPVAATYQRHRYRQFSTSYWKLKLILYVTATSQWRQNLWPIFVATMSNIFPKLWPIFDVSVSRKFGRNFRPIFDAEVASLQLQIFSVIYDIFSTLQQGRNYIKLWSKSAANLQCHRNAPAISNIYLNSWPISTKSKF